MRHFDRLCAGLKVFQGCPPARAGGIKIRLSEIRSTAKDRVRIFPGKASVGLKKIHSAIFCCFFLKKVEGKKKRNVPYKPTADLRFRSVKPV